MCNREYQEAGGPKYSAVDPETNSAYGATVGMCTFIRIIARAVGGGRAEPDPRGSRGRDGGPRRPRRRRASP